MDNQFRGAAFGGFNRQDVMEYLERTAKEHAEGMAQLRAQLEQAQQECGELRAQLEQAQEQTKLLTEERDRIAQENEQLPRLQEEADALRSRVARLEPDAQAYAAIKERAAGMELEAHRRAQQIVDDARGEAGDIHRQMEQWLGRFGREYEELCAQVDATVAHAAGELDKVRVSLDGISQCMERQNGALNGMARVFAEQDPAKVPAPLPLD